MRKRRTAEEARRVILDAAELRLEEVGPAGIRLQQIAEDVGMSHPAILHHFGSREGLVNAVLGRVITHLRNDLIASFGEAVDAERAAGMLERVFEALGDSGHARVLAWLILSGETGGRGQHGEPAALLGDDRALQRIGEAVHALRLRGDAEADLEDTLFSVILAALAIFGDAIVGDVMRKSAGVDATPDAGTRFREWLAKLLVGHLERVNPPS